MAAEGAAGVARFVVELARSGDAVTGSVSVEGGEAAVTFSGWLELLALLEGPEPVAEVVDD